MIPLKPHRQSPSFCGPASLKMVLEYYGVSLSEEEVGRRAHTTVAHGTRAEELARVAIELGFSATVKEHCTLDDLRSYLAQGIPPIVNWFSEDDGHYSVVVEMKDGMIYLQDPELGHVRALPEDTFLRIWFDFTGDFPEKEDFVVRRMIVVEK